MRIVVDADAMPSIHLIEEVAKEYLLPCLLIADDTHVLKSDYSEVIIVSKGFQSVDMYLVNILKKNDIVVTQDYGVAAIALAKGSFAINPKGHIYTEQNIDGMMNQRHLGMKLRKQKIHTKGPKKRTREDDQLLSRHLKQLIEEQLK